MFILLVTLLAQAGVGTVPSHPPSTQPGKAGVPPNVRCVADSFGNYTCTDGSRVLRDSSGGFTVIPGRR